MLQPQSSGQGRCCAAHVLPELLLRCARHPLSLDCAPVPCRILRGEYEVPPGASPHCLDLLRRIMTVDCDKRITIPEIMRHPWFLEDLPLGLEEANASLLEAPLALQFCKQSEVKLSGRPCTARCPANPAHPLWFACFRGAAEAQGKHLQVVKGVPVKLSFQHCLGLCPANWHIACG